jgi:hypothetical protein
MDHLRAHKVTGIREALVKTAWRKAKARTREALDRAVAHALPTITAADARHWCAHCGYPVP